MLNIFYGDMKEAVYNTASYFKYDYEEDWIVDPMVKEMIQDVDKSTVIDSGVIDSPVLGKISPIGLSGGVKTLILVKFEPEKVFNVEEVYGIRTSGKYGVLKQSYHSFYRIYPDSTNENIKPEKILTEKTAGTYLDYTKKTLNETYLKDGVKNAILDQVQKVELN